MRYIKLFEVYKNKILEQDVIDCFQDLNDSGFIVSVGKKKQKKIICIDIIKKQKDDYSIDTFNIDDVKEVLLFAIPYISNTYDVKIRPFVVDCVSIHRITYIINNVDDLSKMIDDLKDNKIIDIYFKIENI